MKKRPGFVLIVLTTVPKQADAARISRALIKKRVAACANVVPGVRSFYWWEGKLVRGREVLVVLKTTSGRYRALEETIRTVHPYKVPEILAIPVKKGNVPYLAWVSKEVID